MISKKARERVFKLTEQLAEPLDLTSHLPFRIAVVSNLLALNRDWKIRKLCDLDPREMRVLINIGSYMPIKSADIAYQSRLDSYTVSRAVKKLQQLELVEITQDAVHKNIKNLMLNARGQLLYREIINALEQRCAELEEVLDDHEVQLFYKLLDKIENRTEQILAEQALELIEQGHEPPADQREIIRWYRRGLKS